MTATTQTFSAMVNEYLPNKLLKEELIKRDWLLQNCPKDDKWKGGNLIVPFEGAGASSIKFGSLTAETDIAQYEYVRGIVSGYKEVWGTLKFEHKDLMVNNKVSEQSFLDILPRQVEDFMGLLKETVSENLLNGANFSSGVAFKTDGTDGIISVTSVERFCLGQKANSSDDGATQDDVYVIAIDLEDDYVTFSKTRGGAAADLSVGDLSWTAASVKFYHDGIIEAGVVTNGFASLTDSILSLKNGGSAALYGKTKLSYPYLQAINVSGSGLNAATFAEGLFDAYTSIRRKARGNATKMVMSYSKLAALMKHIETGLGGNGSSGGKGAFKVTATSTKASLYGWTEIEIVSVKGTLTAVGVQEMADDKVLFLDMSSFKFYSDGMFQKRKSPEGDEFFEVRATTGYSYILDVCLFGELVLLAPTKCGILHSIPAF